MHAPREQASRVTLSSAASALGKAQQRPIDMTEQLHLLIDRPIRNQFARRHPMFEQRAPELEIVGGKSQWPAQCEPAFREADAGPSLSASMRKHRAFEGARSHPQDQLIHVLTRL